MAEETKVRAKLELVGEAQYRAAMADINRQLKETKTALAAAAAEYQNEDAAMRTNAAQVEALNRSLEQQRERYATMEEHLKKVNEVYGENSKQAVKLRTDMNNARAEMAKTQTQLRGLSDGLEGAAQAGEAMGRGTDSAQAAMERIGDAAQGAQDDVRGLAGEIGDVVGKKFIEFGLGKEVLDQLANGVKWAFNEALTGQKEYGLFLSGAGDPVLAAARAAIQGNIDKVWAGRLTGSQTQNAIETVDTNMGNTSLTNPAYVEKIANMAITTQERWNVSVLDSITLADDMRKTFGSSWEEIYDLMNLGFQNAHDGGAQMLKVMDENANMFKAMGYDADDMFSVIIAACNDENLGKDSNLNKGMTQLYNTLTSGSKESKKILKELVMEVTDWPDKLQKGGETAAKAMEQLLSRLMAIEDVGKRNELGRALFGDTVWTQTGGDIANALLAGFGQTIESAGTTDFVQNAMLDNLSDAWAQVGERGAQQAESAMKPVVEGTTKALQGLSSSIDENGGSIVKGYLSMLGKSAGELADIAVTGTKANLDALKTIFEVDPASMSRAGSMAGEAWAEGYVESVGEATDQAVQDAAQNTEPVDVSELIKLREQAIDEDNEALATALDRQIQAAVLQAQETGQQGGQQIGESTAGAVTDAIEGAEADTQTAGETLGGGAVTGLEDGLDGMRDASASAADGAVAELFRAVSRFFNAGQAAGKAYERGYKNALDEHSPSRVMRLAAQYSVQGLLEGYDEGESEVAARGAALAEAFNSAYTGRSAAYAGAGDAQDAGTGISAGVLAEAVRESLDGVGVYLDGKRVGELTAPGVSAGIARSSAATVRGRSARTKGW